MSAELKIMDSSLLSEQERTELETNIDALIAAHKNNRQEINRLVFESVAAMTAGEDYERQLANKKGLRRFLGGITGSNKKLQDKINSSRAAAQYASQQTLQRLAEQNLMSFDLITAVNNKLNASVIAIESEINQIYAALAAFFKQSRSDMIQLENRVERLERNVNLLNWQNSIEYQMFDEIEYSELDDTSKIVCIARDFYDITKGEWTTSDLLLLKAAMGQIGIQPKEKLKYFDFIKSVFYNSHLRKRLLNGESISHLPEPYLIPLSGLKKLELLDGEEHYIVDTLMGTLADNGIVVQPTAVSEDLTRKFLEQENQINLDVLIENYDLVLELLFNLKQAEHTTDFQQGTCEISEVEYSGDKTEDLSALEPAEAADKRSVPECSQSADLDMTPIEDESVADKIYKELSPFGKAYVETKDYFVCSGGLTLFSRLFGRKGDIHVISKKDGSNSCLIPEENFPRPVCRRIGPWICGENRLYAFFSEESNGEAEVYILDTANGNIDPAGFKVDPFYVCAANKHFFVYSDQYVKLICIDLLNRKKYRLQHEDHYTHDRICTEDVLYFTNDSSPRTLMEYSFHSRIERKIADGPGRFDCVAMSLFDSKIFIIHGSLSYGIGYFDLNSKQYIEIERAICLEKSSIEKCECGFLFLVGSSINYFDFRTMQRVTLATDCKGAFYKIGNWIYYEQGEDHIKTRVSIDRPMEMELLGEDL